MITSETPVLSTTGRLVADAFPSLQDAVDAVGDQGGIIELSAKTYELSKPLRIRERIVFAGVLDAKTRRASTKIQPALNFKGSALFETVYKAARTNPDLNADIQFRDLVIVGNQTITALKATNADVIRLERCRIARVFRCIDVSLVTDLPRPFIDEIVPGGLFINNCIFHAHDICLNIEYATQNRIYANWFVSDHGIAVRLLNTNKTWFVANEINSFKRCALLLEDDGGEGNHVHNVIISSNWMHSQNPETKFIETINPSRMRNIVVQGNIMEGAAGVDLPLPSRNEGNIFTGNSGTGAVTEVTGTVEIAPGETTTSISHKLVSSPTHISLTPESAGLSFWVKERNEQNIVIVTENTSSTPGYILWQATV